MDKIEQRRTQERTDKGTDKNRFLNFRIKNYKKRRKKNLSYIYLKFAQSARFVLGRLPQETQVKNHKNC